MFSRHKRMQYDPPGERKRKKRNDRHLRVDQIELNRRTLLMKTGLVGVFGTMAAKLGYMQLVQGEAYREKAQENVINTEFLPAARGLIVDRRGRRLAENRRSWELLIHPDQLPDEKEEAEARQHVLDTLISALQIEDTLVAQQAGMRKGSENTVFSRVATMLGYTGEDAAERIDYWTKALDREIYLNLTPNGGLTQDDAARFRAAINEMPGIQVMNRLVWQIENQWSKRLPVLIASDVPRETALKLEANKMYLPGVELNDDALVRQYNGGEVMSHVIGYVAPIDAALVDDPRYMGENGERIYEQNDVIGKVGVEQALEKDLRGQRGRREVEVDAMGIQQRVIPKSTRDAVAGQNIWLTIDLELQQAVGKILEEQVAAAAEAKETANQKRLADGRDLPWKIPTGGAVVAYDPRNGEIHAMVSYPYYDNQLFISGISSRKWNEYIEDNGPKAFLNRCVDEAYPPGSTYKVFLAASALDRGSLTVNNEYYCSGCIAVPSTTDYTNAPKWACWKGWSGGEHGTLDVYGAIRESCDVFFYNVASEREEPVDSPNQPVFYWDYHLLEQSIANETKHVFDGEGIASIVEDMTEKFWFGKYTGIEIAEGKGFFPTPEWKIDTFSESWTVGDSLNLSIGQGEFRATPLQMAFNTGIIAANGEVRTPTIVHKKTQELPKVSQVLAATPQSAVATPQSATPAPTTTASTPTEEVVRTDPDAQLGMKAEALEVVQEGMRQVVQSELGTAHASAGVTKWPKLNPTEQLEDGSIELINVAGKTGTAEFGLTDDIGAADTHAWFTCYAPMEDPEIAVAVIIEAGGEGSTFAVPVADTVLRGYFELTGRRERGVVLSKDPLPV
ncbi:MAG: hypothetical protein KC435_03360 [Thermomicrobiales bacterium]|nr:hypothetical protein [Thermomicrobiales bacterium]